MYTTLIKELPFNYYSKEKIQISIPVKEKLTSKAKINKTILTEDIGIKSPYFKLTITCSILLVIISGIIMYFSWRI